MKYQIWPSLHSQSYWISSQSIKITTCNEYSRLIDALLLQQKSKTMVMKQCRWLWCYYILLNNEQSYTTWYVWYYSNITLIEYLTLDSALVVTRETDMILMLSRMLIVMFDDWAEWSSTEWESTEWSFVLKYKG